MKDSERIPKERLRKDLEKVLELPLNREAWKYLWKNYSAEERSKRVGQDILYYSKQDKIFGKLSFKTAQHLLAGLLGDDTCDECPEKERCRKDGQGKCPD